MTTMTASVTAGSYVSYEWDLGDGSSRNGNPVIYEYLDIGVYTAVVTASNGSNALSASTTVTITDVPISGLVVSNDSPTELGDPTMLSASVAVGSNVVYTWDLGDGSGDAGAVVEHSYPAVGTYSAVVTATNSANSLSASTAVTITIPPCQARIDGDPAVYRTVQAAVGASVEGDLIKISGHCTGINTLGYPFEQVRIDKTVTLRGGYSPDFGTWDPVLYPTVLDAEGAGRVVYIQVPGSTPITPTLESLHLTNGNSDIGGGGLYFYSSSIPDSHVVISDCQVYSNSAKDGGGLYLYAGATVLNNEIYHNSAGNHGYGLVLGWSENALIEGNHVYSNTGAAATGTHDDGAIYLHDNSNATLRDNDIHHNGYSNKGAGVSLYNNTDTTLDGNRIYGHSSSDGAGVYMQFEEGPTLIGNELFDNHGDEGGALGMEYGSGLTLIDNRIHHNSASSSGGGVYIYQGPNTTLSGNVFRDNDASYGGGVLTYLSDGTNLIGNEFVDNHALWYGGGIRIIDALTVTIVANLVYGNAADHGGGGIVLGDLPDARLVNNIVADNHHTGGYSAGGIQISSSNVEMVHNTVAGNVAWGVYALNDVESGDDGHHRGRQWGRRLCGYQ